MSQDPDDPSTSTSSPNFQTIFADALKEYKKRTKKDIAAYSLAEQITSCDSPNAVLTVLQTQVQTFDPSPSANEMWSRLLNPTITVLFAFSGFVRNIAGPVFPPAAAIFTGIGALLQAFRDVRATQDTLVDLFGRMQLFFLRLEKYIAVRPTAAMKAVIIQIMVAVISILGIATKEIKEGRFKKFFKRLFGINRLDNALQQLDNSTQEEARMAVAEALMIGARTEERVIHMGANVEDINEGVTEAKEKLQVVLKYVSDRDRNESRKDLRQWINPPDPSSNLYTAFDAHHEGTAAWCTEGKTFANWMESGSLLWIHGKPGAGKTILSSVIIRHIENMPSAESVLLAYFYFDFKDEGKKDSRALLSSLVDQLSNQSDQFRDILRGLYSEHQDGSKKPQDDALLRCLKDMLTLARPVPIYLVMDALDECPNDSGDRSSRSPRGKVLTVVEELIELRLPNLHLCIMSRPELDIRTFLKPLAPQEISLHDESGQNQDINAYVTSVVQLVKNWRASDKEMVVSELTKNADGMFRWVYCQLEVLRNCLPKNLRRVLKELPKSLDETYQRILKEINNANQKEAHQLLQCLAVAYRPLRVEELAEVLALDVDAAGIPRFNANWRWEDHEAAVLSACSSLVSVIYYAGSRVFQFSHFSVKEFLTSDRLASLEDVSQFHISNEPSHAILAQACLGVLLSVDDHTSDDNIEDIALLPYADDYWGEHVRIGKVELHIKDALDSLFDVHKTHFEASFRRIGMDHLLRPFRDEDSKGVLTPAALLIFAGVIGFSGLAERLIVANQPQAIGSRFQGWTQLHLVVRFEGIEVARLLLAHGADINSRPDYATSPHIASLQSHIERPVDGMTEEIDEIENSLHDSNADVSIDDIMGCGKESGFTPLHIAALKGHFNMCQMLLEHKADLRARDSRGNTPLHLATYEYHLEIARILLEYNVEVDSRNEDGSTPLFIASSNRNVDISRYRDIMRLLLDHGANVNAHDNRRNTPLHVAASEGDLEVARMLLEHKADANALGNEGSTPLHKASQGSRSRGEGQEMVQLSRLVRLFLDNGADPHAHDDNGSTPLHFAVSKGHLEVTRMLLERKADVNSLNGEGLTPLQRASEGPRKGYPDIMQLLHDHGANVNVHDNRRNTPLHFAASEGHLEIARMLLEHKADVNALGIEGSTPLHKASQGSQSCGGGLEMVQLVRLFLDNGADPHVRDDNGSTPLHFAVSKGHLEVTRMLLELKADVNSFNGEGLTPLQRALEGPREGYPDFMRLLLDHGANVNVHDNRRSTLLHFAASEGHLEVARMLLERKANVNALDDEGSTPLHQASHSSQSGDADITQLVRLLLDNGADPHACDNNGNTPLHFAASEGHLEVVRTLLERKADVDSLNGEGLAPLQRASEGRREGYLDIMRLLLDHGANVNVHDNSRNTPLHFAASRSHLEVARMLLELKADVNALNKEGSTPLHQAFETWRKNPDIVRLLLDHGADANVHDKRGNTLLHFAASEGDLKITRVLLERIVEVVNSQNDDGYTAFLLALKRQNLDVARLLLDHNPDVHVRDERGYTPLHVAVRNGHLDICRILLERNADVNSQTHHRSTPLLIASEVGTPDLVQLFLDHNADVHVCDADGDTPLHCATIGGKLEVARLLLKLDIEVNSRNNKGLTPLHLASAGYRVRNPDIVRLLLDHGADAQAQSHGGETASKVARAPNWQEIVQLLTQNVAE